MNYSNSLNGSGLQQHHRALGAASFDILSLRNFKPARARCQNCLALLKSVPINKQGQIQCPVCQIRYDVEGESRIERFRSHFKEQGCYIDIDHILEHRDRLASIAHRVQQYQSPPLAGLLASLKHAQAFVHVVSWGISRELLLALKMTAQSVPVRGIVSIYSDQDWLLSELEAYKKEAPNLEIKAICSYSRNWEELPHQKLVIVDGLLAFKGSANLTLTAWRKAERGYEEVEVVTEVEKVINLHNRLFSPIWSELSDSGAAIAIAG